MNFFKTQNLRIVINLLFIFTIISITFYNTVDAQSEKKLIASDGKEYAFFGRSVSISGNYAVVGAAEDGSNGKALGSVYIFKYNGSDWIENSKLIADDSAEYNGFGYSVSIYGDFVIVGARLDDDMGTDAGAAYIFKRNGDNWSQEAKLFSNDVENDDCFGNSVSINGNYVIIGSLFDDDNGSNSGSAYIFKRDNNIWKQEYKLTAVDGAEGDFFGFSVSISGDYAVVGAHYDDDNGESTGSAYIFKRDGIYWIQESKIRANDRATGDEFGRSVSICGNRVAVGARWDDDNGINSGSTYIFKQDGANWIQEAKLIANDGKEDDYFGISVSIENNYVIIGACYNNDTGMPHWNHSGSTYIFKYENDKWNQMEKLTASDAAANDIFGNSVSISNGIIIVGAYEDDNIKGTDAGSAYIYYSDNPIPVELCSFIASPCEHGVSLQWCTQSETNNYGFEIERSINNDWEKIGFVRGKGTTNVPQNYDFFDTFTGQMLADTYYQYRLKQIDTDGTYKYSKIVKLKLNLPITEYILKSYPNPFNSYTKICFILQKLTNVTLKIYNNLGQEIETLLNNKSIIGNYEITWNSKDRPSGIYFCYFQVGQLVTVHTLILLK